jgi:hypothetical protein
MSLFNLPMSDLVGTIIAFIFTLMVFSYVFGDNALFRVALHIFIGVAAGYAAVVAFYNVIWPQMLIPIIFGSQSERLFVLFPLVLGGLLLFKVSSRFNSLGNPAVAYLVGVGVATVIGGAVLGTVFPQILATINLFDRQAPGGADNTLWQFIQGSIIMVGTISTLAYFHFGVRPVNEQTSKRPKWMEVFALIGQVFIAITLGALFAGVYAASLTALIERLKFLGEVIFSLFLP